MAIGVDDGVAALHAALEPEPTPPADLGPLVGQRLLALLAAALVALALTSTGAAAALVGRNSQLVGAAAAAAQTSDTWQDASHAATVEQSIERAWRLGHDGRLLGLHRRAAAELHQAVDRTSSRAGPAAVRQVQELSNVHDAAWAAENTARTAAAAGPASLRAEASAEDLQDLLTKASQDSYARTGVLQARAAGKPIGVVCLLLLAALCTAGAGGVLWLRQRRLSRHLRQLQERSEHLALNDELTGLPNRIVLRDRLEQALRATGREGGAMALLVIDLDQFKQINDALGHDYGDQLLAQIGPRLAGPLRATDTVARLGGDEFAVLLPRIADRDAALLVAEKLQEALVDPFHVHGLLLSIEASIGVAIAPDDGLDAHTILSRADIAMYVAKDGGFGVSAYDASLDGSSPTRAALLGELRRAIDGGELIVMYQPKCTATTGAVEGVEALVRWQHPERGLLSPDQFLPLAERTGLIHPLTRHVLQTALADCRRMLEAGLEVPVAVNLSARTLLDRGFVAEVEQMLAYWRVPAHLLELEVTETILMADPERACALLERLSALGCVLAIDDFGTGYSSLASLRTLPVHDVKIDRTFVTSMLTNPSDAFIVRWVIALAHDVGLRVVAEGVEDDATLAALAELGCDVVQGYQLGVPMTALALLSDLTGGRELAAPVLRVNRRD